MGVTKRTRMRRSRAEWERILARFESSGQAPSEFCRNEGIAPGTFSRWRARLAQGEAHSGAFVEWSTPTAPVQRRGLAPGEMELLLPGGVRLRLRS